MFVSPVLFQDGIGYVMVQSENVHKTISPAQYNQNLLLALVSSISIFILLFLLFMIPITRYIKEIERGIQKIVKKIGNIPYVLKEKMNYLL